MPWRIQVSNQERVAKSLCKMLRVKFPALHFLHFLKSQIPVSVLKVPKRKWRLQEDLTSVQSHIQWSPVCYQKGKEHETVFSSYLSEIRDWNLDTALPKFRELLWENPGNNLSEAHDGICVRNNHSLHTCVFLTSFHDHFAVSRSG